MTPRAKGKRAPGARPSRSDLAPRKSTSRAPASRAATVKLERGAAVSFSGIMARLAGEAPPVPADGATFPRAAAAVAELMEELDRAILQGLVLWRRACRNSKSGYSEVQLTLALGELADAADAGNPTAYRALSFNPTMAPVLEALRLKDRLRVAQGAIACGDLEDSIAGLVRLLRSVIRPAAGGLEGLANIARGRGARDARKRGGKAPKPRPSKLPAGELRKLRERARAIKARSPRLSWEKIAARLLPELEPSKQISADWLARMLRPRPGEDSPERS